MPRMGCLSRSLGSSHNRKHFPKPLARSAQSSASANGSEDIGEGLPRAHEPSESQLHEDGAADRRDGPGPPVAGLAPDERAAHVLDDRDEWVQQQHFLQACLLYTSDAADDLLCVDLGGRRII